MGCEAILIIDDHALFRSGIVALLSTAFAHIPIHDGASLDEVLNAADITPTIILLDIQLKGVNGIESIGLLRRRWPTAQIIIVSADDLSVTVGAALERGAAAFLSKADRPEQMIAVLRAMLKSPTTAPPAADDRRPSLTLRQTEVLSLVEQGLSNKLIGRRLGLSEHTVRGHVQALLSELGAARRSEAAFKARRLGLIR